MLDPHWDSSWISYCCPVSWKSCSLGQQDQPLHIFLQNINGVDVGVGQRITLFLGLDIAELASPLALRCILYHNLLWLHRQGELSSIVLARSPLAVMNKGQGPFYCTFALRVNTTTPEPSEPALLCCLAKVQGPLSEVLQLVRDRDVLPLLGPRDQLTLGSKGQ